MIADMAAHVDMAYDTLVSRARSGLYRPGDRFMSNRAVATRLGVSYQTAHRLLGKMVAEGILQRTDRSGTYLAGRADRPTSARLIFHPRADRPDSFGAKLLDCLQQALRTAGIRFDSSFDDKAPIPPNQLPILWETPRVLQSCLKEQRRAILLNDRPRAGLEATFIDSIAIDDFAGGVMAAQFLVRSLGTRNRLAVIGGPRRDVRSRARIAGFVSEVPATVIHAKDWFEPSGQAAGARILGKKPIGVFCCNDRLAEGLLHTIRQFGQHIPALVGFDDAPIAERLGLTTIAIPWDAMASAITRMLRERLAGSNDPATHLVLFPRIVLRTVTETTYQPYALV